MPAPPISPLLASNDAPVVAPAASPWSRSLSALQRGGILITIVLAAVAFSPLLAEHLRALTSSPDYQHAPLVLLAMAFLLWQRWPARAEPRDEVQRRPLGLLVGMVG